MTDRDDLDAMARMTHSHAALVAVEAELRQAGRTVAADGLAYADLVVLAARNALSERIRRAQG